MNYLHVRIPESLAEEVRKTFKSEIMNLAYDYKIDEIQDILYAVSDLDRELEKLADKRELGEVE